MKLANSSGLGRVYHLGSAVTARVDTQFEILLSSLDRFLDHDQRSANPKFPERTSFAFLPGEVFDCLLRHGVQFILFGGLAAMYYGWPGPTSDVDIVPDPKKSNRRAIAYAAYDMTSKRPQELAARLAKSRGAGPVWNIHDFGLDLMFNPFYPEVGGYYEILRNSLQCSISSGSFHVASREDVIKSMECGGLAPKITKRK